MSLFKVLFHFFFYNVAFYIGGLTPGDKNNVVARNNITVQIIESRSYYTSCPVSLHSFTDFFAGGYSVPFFITSVFQNIGYKGGTDKTFAFFIKPYKIPVFF